MKRTLSVLLPLLGLSLTACGWDKSPSPARSLSGYFSTCATASESSDVRRKICEGYAQTLKGVAVRPVVVLDRAESSVPGNLATYTLSNILYTNGALNLRTGIYDTAAGTRVNVVCANDGRCTVDGEGLFIHLSPLSQTITDGAVYDQLKATAVP
ncbi:hypothetical protein [Deinococcus sp. PESE-13]